MSTTLGVSLITLGLSKAYNYQGIKGAFRMYRHIRSRSYLDPLRMYPGGFY